MNSPVKQTVIRKRIKSESKHFPGRSKQFDLLAGLFGEPGYCQIPSIFVYGHASTGKTVVVRHVLETAKNKFVWVNCVEAYTPRLLLELVLNQLSDFEPSVENLFEGHSSCLNVCDFIRLLTKATVNLGLQNETIYVVFDNAERLREMPPSLLAAILRLQELSKLNLCVILITELVWEKFHNDSSFYKPLCIHFSNYTKEETVDILLKDCPSQCSDSFYSEYIELVLSVFYHATRNLQELRFIALSNFPKYYQPIESGNANDKDIMKLWRNIEPHLKSSLNFICLREVENPSNGTMDTVSKSTLATQRANVELPFYSKYLLIAAYIASYNPPAYDKKFFIKNTGKTFKKRKSTKSIKKNQHQKGPKFFPLHRLLAIFYSIVEERVQPSVSLLSQISTLITLRLLVCNSDNYLLSPKYKCLVNLDFIRSIASALRFDIISYLTDFV